MAAPPPHAAGAPLGVRYGLYPFLAENDDEISFAPGERIVILEQDDQYGDGWWQGRNEAGQEGLFPALDYTSPDPPASAGPSQTTTTTTVEDRRASQLSLRGPNGLANGAAGDRPPSPRAASPVAGGARARSPSRSPPASPKQLANSAGARTEDGQPSPQMNATLTDVQAAIDQLAIADPAADAAAASDPLAAAAGADGDPAGTRSLLFPGAEAAPSVRSFVSDDSRDGGPSGNGFGGSSGGGGGGGVGGKGDEDHSHAGWSAKTRRRLAEKALAENERQRSREAAAALTARNADEGASRGWEAAPSAATDGLEFSDESDDDESQQGATPRLNGKDGPLSPPLEHGTLATAAPVAPESKTTADLAPPVDLDAQLHRDVAQTEASAKDVPVSSIGLTKVLSESPPSVTPTHAPATPSETPLPPDAPAAATPAERAEQAFHKASTAPSALAQEPSPFQTIVPDQVDAPAPVAAEAAEQQPRPASFVVARKPSGDLRKVASPPPRSAATLPTSPRSTLEPLPDAGSAAAAAAAAPQNERMASLPASVASASGGDRGSVGSASGYMSPGGLRRPGSSAGAGLGTAGVAGEPIEWGVADVVEWAKRRGFDESVWGKFEEHEITGDVLLEMDINLLKEIEITAFGKRMKLAAAISELRHRHDGLGSHATPSIRSGHSPTLASFTPHASGGPSPGFVFGQQQARAGADSFAGSGGLPSSASQYASNWGQEQQAVLNSAPATAAPVVGLGFATEDKQSRQSSLSAPPSPLSTTTSAPAPIAAAYTPSHGRTPSNVESLHGTRIDEEPANYGDAPQPASRASPTLGPKASPLLKSPATISRTDVGSVDSRASASIPPSPAAPGSTFARRAGSISHKKSKASVDEGRGDRSGSVFGSLMGGTMGRKPAPRVSGGSASNASPDLSSKSPRLGSAGFRRPSKPAGDDKGTLKKRMSVVEPENSPRFPQGEGGVNPGAARALDRIPKPEFAGYLRKRGERYNSWKMRYCVLSGPHFYYLKSENDAKFKGYINLQGYKVIADENAHPGSYGFRIIHDREPAHFFSLQEQHLVRDWMKALMKATISRDYSAPVISSCNIPTMSLKEAQSMSPAPRPPSPTQRLATQMASRRDNPNQLTARDASILMGLQNGGAGDGQRKPSVPDALGTPVSAPPRPSRDISRTSISRASNTAETRPLSSGRPSSGTGLRAVDGGRPVSGAAAGRPPSNGRPVSGFSVPGSTPQLQFINANLPPDFPPVTSNPESFRSGLALVRAVEHITGISSDIPIKDFVVKTRQEHEDLLYRAFDYFIDAGVQMDGLHVDDVVVGNAAGIDKIVDRIAELKK